MSDAPPRVDYDRIASRYDRRYVYNDYSGIEQALTAFVGSSVDTRALEVGCGTGHWLRVIRGRGVSVFGLDASIGMLAQARTCCPVVHGQAEHLPWASRSFDRVFCVNALHHFRDPRAFFFEARRVLRPGGRLMTIGLDPHTGRDRWYIYDYFESVLDTDRRRFPASSQIREWMAAVQFVDCVTQEVQHLPLRLPARAALEQGRFDRGATSQLSILTDEQYRQGIDRIRRDIASADAKGDSLHVMADLRLYATVGSLP